MHSSLSEAMDLAGSRAPTAVMLEPGADPDINPAPCMYQPIEDMVHDSHNLWPVLNYNQNVYETQPSMPTGIRPVFYWMASLLDPADISMLIRAMLRDKIPRMEIEDFEAVPGRFIIYFPDQYEWEDEHPWFRGRQKVFSKIEATLYQDHPDYPTMMKLVFTETLEDGREVCVKYYDYMFISINPVFQEEVEEAKEAKKAKELETSMEKSTEMCASKPEQSASGWILNS